MKVIYDPRAAKHIARLPAADRRALHIKLVRYAETGQGDVVKLVGRNEFRLRHGDWRAIFELHANVVVIKVAHRSEVYR